MSEFPRVHYPCLGQDGLAALASVRHGWLLVAGDLLRDALRGTLSASSREDCAFDAGYLYALAAIGVEAAQAVAHPHPDALLAAARALGWPNKAMDPAISHLKRRYSPRRDGSKAEPLLRWAFQMQKAAADSLTAQPNP